MRKGDKVLKAVSDRFRKVIRPWDTVARFGGDEFVVLFEDIEDERTALRATNRLAKVLEDPIELTEGPGARDGQLRCSPLARP